MDHSVVLGNVRNDAVSINPSAEDCYFYFYSSCGKVRSVLVTRVVSLVFVCGIGRQVSISSLFGGYRLGRNMFAVVERFLQQRCVRFQTQHNQGWCAYNRTVVYLLFRRAFFLVFHSPTREFTSWSLVLIFCAASTVIYPLLLGEPTFRVPQDALPLQALEATSKCTASFGARGSIQAVM